MAKINLVYTKIALHFQCMIDGSFN